MSVPTALTRPVPDSFDGALVRDGQPELDVALARAQHDDYREALEQSGYSIVVVPTDENHPDCVFIEDTAIVLGSVAVITRPGAPSRRGETDPVARVLSSQFPLVEVREPGTVDGGDVFVMGDVAYVGRSTRTNVEGIHQLQEVTSEQGLELVTVDVHNTLHLKSAVLPIDIETVVVTRDAVDETMLEGLRIIYEADSERHKFSALPLHDDRVLVTANAPATTEVVSTLGHEVVPIDVSQIQAADGGLTCMSILFSAD
jgi:dimethylargininase